MNKSIVTFLRDPVERVISRYFFHLGEYKRITGKDADVGLISFAESHRNFMHTLLNGSINNVDFIGITEYYDESISKFCDYLDIENFKEKWPRINISQRKNVSIKDRRYIEKLNTKDYILYCEALKRFRINEGRKNGT